MLLKTRPKLVLEVLPSRLTYSGPRPRPAGPAIVRPRPFISAVHYDGIPPPPKICWIAVLFSVVFHAGLILGFSDRPVARPKVVVEEAPVIQMVMPDLPDEEEPKPVELAEEDTFIAPSIQVPMLADIPIQIPTVNSFTQLLDLTVPVKSSDAIANINTIPLNIRHGRPDTGAIKNLFNIADLDRQPEPIVQLQPEYPYELKRKGIEGRVRVGFIITSKGEAILPYIISSSHSEFEQPAMAAVQKWRFRPGMKNGRKVNVRVEQPITFSLDKN